VAVSGTHTAAARRSSTAPRARCTTSKAVSTRSYRGGKFYYVAEDSTPALDANMRSAIAGKAQAAAARGLRVIAMAYGYGSIESARTELLCAVPAQVTPLALQP